MTGEHGLVLVEATLPLLRRGSEGPFVARLQALLNAVSAAGLAVDSRYGPRTEEAVEVFQASSHLLVDGVVGAQTWTVLLSLRRGLAAITVRQPQPFDLVDEPVALCGIATAFEGTINLRVRDGGGGELASSFLQAGSNGALGNFAGTVAVGGVPSSPQGTLEVFEVSAEDGSELHKVVVAITFGRVLVDPYTGFLQHTVVEGETLSRLARHFYGDPGLLGRIFEANRHVLGDPDRVFPGQVLRIPQ